MKLERIDSVSPTNTFVVSSGALRVTDPCYDMDTWCAGTLPNVMDGIWQAHVGYHKDSLDMEMNAKWRAQRAEQLEKAKASGSSLAEYYAEELRRYDEGVAAYIGRVAYLHIVNIGAQSHFDYMAEFDSTWTDSEIDVGVDSGQAGFFDLEMYQTVKKEAAVEEKFYDEICDLTLDDKGWGVHPTGVVSSSGYGDGGYTCLVRRNDEGKAIEAIIVYLAQYDEDDSDV